MNIHIGQQLNSKCAFHGNLTIQFNWDIFWQVTAMSSAASLQRQRCLIQKKQHHKSVKEPKGHFPRPEVKRNISYKVDSVKHFQCFTASRQSLNKKENGSGQNQVMVKNIHGHTLKAFKAQKCTTSEQWWDFTVNPIYQVF